MLDCVVSSDLLGVALDSTKLGVRILPRPDCGNCATDDHHELAKIHCGVNRTSLRGRPKNGQNLGWDKMSPLSASSMQRQEREKLHPRGARLKSVNIGAQAKFQDLSAHFHCVRRSGGVQMPLIWLTQTMHAQLRTSLQTMIHMRS